MTHTVPKPKVHRIPREYLGGYSFHLTDAYGDVRKYMVRKGLSHPEWGWDVYVIRRDDPYKWELIIDQMSTMDYAMRVAVAHSLERGLAFVSATDVQWGQEGAR